MTAEPMAVRHRKDECSVHCGKKLCCMVDTYAACLLSPMAAPTHLEDCTAPWNVL